MTIKKGDRVQLKGDSTVAKVIKVEKLPSGRRLVEVTPRLQLRALLFEDELKVIKTP